MIKQTPLRNGFTPTWKVDDFSRLFCNTYHTLLLLLFDFLLLILVAVFWPAQCCCRSVTIALAQLHKSISPYHLPFAVVPFVQRVRQRKRSCGEPSRIPSAQGGTEIGKGDERIHELDLQSRYRTYIPSFHCLVALPYLTGYCTRQCFAILS